jgi:hypothetical protein
MYIILVKQHLMGLEHQVSSAIKARKDFLNRNRYNVASDSLTALGLDYRPSISKSQLHHSELSSAEGATAIFQKNISKWIDETLGKYDLIVVFFTIECKPECKIVKLFPVLLR